MSLTELKHEAERLSPAERRHLAAHLVALERNSEPDFKQKLADQIDDANPSRWVVFEDAKKRLTE